MEPPDPPPECKWCDGQGEVDVESIRDVVGISHYVFTRWVYTSEHLVVCPRCGGTGDEPDVDRYDDPEVP